jgi:hypothetical protein
VEAEEEVDVVDSFVVVNHYLSLSIINRGLLNCRGLMKGWTDFVSEKEAGNNKLRMGRRRRMSWSVSVSVVSILDLWF